MRQRALIHVAGPSGAGKTTFVERLVEAELGWSICVRGRRDPKLRRAARESAPPADPELRRYRAAGAEAVALYRFPKADMEEFFASAVMQEYSDAVIIEGDCPLEYVDTRLGAVRSRLRWETAMPVRFALDPLLPQSARADTVLSSAAGVRP